MQNKSNQSTIIYLVDLIYSASVIIQEHSVVELYKKKFILRSSTFFLLIHNDGLMYRRLFLNKINKIHCLVYLPECLLKEF